MELQKIDAVDAHAVERTLHAFPHDLAGDWHGSVWHPFGESLDRAACVRLQEVARNQLRAAVMVGHVEACQPLLDVALHGGGSSRWIDRLATALHVRDLPQARHGPADGEAGRQFDALELLRRVGRHYSLFVRAYKL